MANRIKICGLTRPRDAQAAAAAGAWAVGVIFARESPRRVDRRQGAAVMAAAGPGVVKVGVFVNEALAPIAAAVGDCGLDAVQLHGDESPAYCEEVAKRCRCKVIKALRVAGPEDIAGVVQFDTDYVLLDTYHPGRRGGTGAVFDWSLAAELPAEVRSGRIILAGGLGPENAAAAIEAVAPFAIDVSSGVESEPGIKDRSRLDELFTRVKRIDK